MNKKEQHLEIELRDHRSEEDLNGRGRVRKKQYSSHKTYLRDMKQLMSMHGVRLRETTKTVVEIHPLTEQELFDQTKKA